MSHVIKVEAWAQSSPLPVSASPNANGRSKSRPNDNHAIERTKEGKKEGRKNAFFLSPLVLPSSLAGCLDDDGGVMRHARRRRRRRPPYQDPSAAVRPSSRPTSSRTRTFYLDYRAAVTWPSLPPSFPPAPCTPPSRPSPSMDR